jgi:hypothetical protein
MCGTLSLLVLRQTKVEKFIRLSSLGLFFIGLAEGFINHNSEGMITFFSASLLMLLACSISMRAAKAGILVCLLLIVIVLSATHYLGVSLITNFLYLKIASIFLLLFPFRGYLRMKR